MTAVAHGSVPPAMAAPSCELTILMPCLNEAETVERCVRKAMRFLEQSGVDGEVVVADNGSTDGSRDLARACGARVVEVPVRGYGAALFHGAIAARGRFIIMGDSDDSYDFSNLQPFVDALRAGNDLVMGNRFRGGIRPGAMPFKNRYLGNPVLSGLGRLFFGTRIRDFHCGLRGLSADAFRRMNLQTLGMEFASEMVIKATLLRLKVAEVETTLDKDGRSRPPHLRPWRDGWRHLRFMLLFSPRWLFFYPGFALIALGVVLSALVLPGMFLLTPRIGLDVHTLIYASAAILLGFQGVLFSYFARVYALHEGFVAEDPGLTRLRGVVSLEKGIAFGLLLILLGLGGTTAAILEWKRSQFGQLDPRTMLRLIVPSVTTLTLGVELVFASFMLSILHLRRRR